MKTLKTITFLATFVTVSAFAAPTKVELTEELKAFAIADITTNIEVEVENSIKVNDTEIKVALRKEAEGADYNTVTIAASNNTKTQVAE